MAERLESVRRAFSAYLIERELGSGGMATVYLAHDKKHDRKVAIKILHAELAAVLGAERFLQEIRVTANQQHLHIPQLSGASRWRACGTNISPRLKSPAPVKAARKPYGLVSMAHTFASPRPHMFRRRVMQVVSRISLNLPLLVALPALAQTGLQGNWQGAWIRSGSRLPVTFAFQQADSALTGSFGSDQLRVVGIPLSKISYRPPAVHFEIVGDVTTTVFDGVLAGDSIAGTFKDGSADGRFVLRRAPKSAANPYHTEEVSFQNGGVKLAGSLLVPSDGKQRHAALLFMHGSGAEGRYASRFLADFLASQGIAALIYDKRGVGASTGNWRNSTFSDLAQDAIAGVEFLKNRQDVDSRRIGIYGHSQGATIAPLVSSRSSAVSFVIASAASGLPATEVERYSLHNSLGGGDLTADEAREAQRYVDLVVESGRLGYRTSALDSAIGRDSAAKWFFTAPAKDSYYWSFSKEIADYNAAKYWRSVHVPVLLLYGENDERVPVTQSVRNIEAALRAAGNRRYTVRIFPHANHSLRLPPNGNGFAWPRNPPGYLETLTKWTLKVTSSRNSKQGVQSSRKF